MHLLLGVDLALSPSRLAAPLMAGLDLLLSGLFDLPGIRPNLDVTCGKRARACKCHPGKRLGAYPGLGEDSESLSNEIGRERRPSGMTSLKDRGNGSGWH